MSRTNIRRREAPITWDGVKAKIDELRTSTTSENENHASARMWWGEVFRDDPDGCNESDEQKFNLLSFIEKMNDDRRALKTKLTQLYLEMDTVHAEPEANLPQYEPARSEEGEVAPGEPTL